MLYLAVQRCMEDALDAGAAREAAAAAAAAEAARRAAAPATPSGGAGASPPAEGAARRPSPAKRGGGADRVAAAARAVALAGRARGAWRGGQDDPGAGVRGRPGWGHRVPPPRPATAAP